MLGAGEGNEKPTEASDIGNIGGGGAGGGGNGGSGGGAGGSGGGSGKATATSRIVELNWTLLVENPGSSVHFWYLASAFSLSHLVL